MQTKRGEDDQWDRRLIGLTKALHCDGLKRRSGRKLVDLHDQVQDMLIDGSLKTRPLVRVYSEPEEDVLLS